MLPAWLLRSEMFFVRVNRFWCVWTRVLVTADVKTFGVAGPGFWRWVV